MVMIRLTVSGTAVDRETYTAKEAEFPSQRGQRHVNQTASTSPTNGSPLIDVPLPAIPAIAMQLLQSLSNQDASPQELARIIRNDPAINAKVLQAANSPVYCVGNNVDTLDRAIVWLGRSTVTCLALSFAISPKRHADRRVNRCYKDYWLRSVTQAVAMETLSAKQQPERKAFAFVAGLLLDIGCLALLQHREQEYVEVMECAKRERQPLHELEQQRLGLTHAAVSAHLLRTWQVPPMFSLLAENHILPYECLKERMDPSHFEAVCRSVAADATAVFLQSTGDVEAFRRLHRITSTAFGHSLASLDRYLQRARERLSEISDSFSLDVSALPPADLFATALEQLALKSYDDFLHTAQIEAENEMLKKRIRELEQLRAPVTNIPC